MAIQAEACATFDNLDSEALKGALQEMGIHAAVGMAVYTGRLNLARLAMMNAADRARQGSSLP